MNIQWKQIELGDFHHYFDEWDSVFGISTHAHGMYHIEFYKKIIQSSNFNYHYLLSGIVGVWNGYAGKHRPAINKADDVIFIRQTNTLHSDRVFSNIKGDNELMEAYFQQNRHKINDERFRIVECKRFLMSYLNYLLRIPDSMGMQAWSPFLDVEVAMAMLNLPEKRRINKFWVGEYFDKVGIGFSQLSPIIKHKNNLNFQATQRIKPPPLNIADYESFISVDYVKWINNSLEHHGKFDNSFWKFVGLPKINRLFKMINIRDQRKAVYHAYLTLKPFEYLLNHRNQQTHG